jgi:hypothetical protein
LIVGRKREDGILLTETGRYVETKGGAISKRRGERFFSLLRARGRVVVEGDKGKGYCC